MWKDAEWYEVAYWWPDRIGSGGDYGGWTKVKTLAEAEALAAKMAAGGDADRVHIRKVTATVIRGQVARQPREK